MNKRPICFVAMAFGKDDTDLFYEKQILPVLKRNGVKPVIINRHQSNDDLNFQIFEQLEKADFCIADLTYTRPSVYFEAGYAQRVIPVIYTVRKDHLGRGQPDDLRVHFDLQMKPIIEWGNATDRTFAKRLENRIKATFLREWVKEKQVDLKYQKSEKEFQSFSSLIRRYLILRDAILVLRKAGYKKSTWGINNFLNRGSYTKSNIETGRVNFLLGYKEKGRILYIASVQSFLSVSKDEILKIGRAYTETFYLPDSLRKMIEERKYKEIRVGVIILNLNPLSASRIESILPYMTPIESSRHYREIISKETFVETEIHADFYFISAIKSTLHLKEQLEGTIAEM